MACCIVCCVRTQALSVLAGVLLVNMLLLMPRLHANAPSSSSSDGPDASSSTGWQLKGLEATEPPAAGGQSAAGRTAAAAGTGRQQQRGVKQPSGDFMRDFDANRDGVLGPTEFQALLQVCAAPW